MKTRTLLIFLLGIVLFECAAAAATVLWQKALVAQQYIVKSRDVVENLRTIVSNVRGSESGVRGYVSTGDRSFLYSYYRSQERIPPTLAWLENQFSSFPIQAANLKLLSKLIADREQAEDHMLGVYERLGYEQVAKLEETREGLHLTQRVERLAKAMEVTETHLSDQRQKTLETAKAWLVGVMVVLLALGIAFLSKAVVLELKWLRLADENAAALVQLELSNHQLNQQVDELIGAKDALDKALKTRSEFVANISHELRTPLAGILGALELALQSQPAAEEADLIQIAKHCAESLLTLVNDILDFEKIDAQWLRLNVSEFNVVESAGVWLKPFEHKAARKKLSFRQYIGGEVPARVVGDAARFRQIVDNLVENAIKFTDTGLIDVSLTVDWQNDNEALVRLSVTDTGVGIPPDQMDKIFDRFVQLDASSTREYGGAGLGLAISRGLARLMGGDIEVMSTPEKGSRFSLTLPLKKVIEEDKAVSGSVGPQPESEESTAVLVADDSEVIRRAVAAQLRRLGYAAETAATGREALQATKTKSYGLIIMDVQLPVMDGFAATRKIRSDADSRCRNTPIVALTAYATAEDREICLKSGMNDCLAKPVAMRILQSTVDKWLVAGHEPMAK